jgi:hypothetical protein
LKCIQMLKLMPKSSRKNPQKTLDTTSALIEERDSGSRWDGEKHEGTTSFGGLTR